MEELLKVLDDLLDEAIKIEIMIDQGFGDKACKKQIRSFATKARALKKTLEQSATAEAEEVSASSTPEPVMVLNSEGEQRPASPEELEQLRAAGAPIGVQDRQSFRDDFGDGGEEIIR